MFLIQCQTRNMDIKMLIETREEIKYLLSHMKSGSILPHVECIYFENNVKPLTFHADYECKQKLVKIAPDAYMRQEELLVM